MWAYPVLLAGVALSFDAADRAVPFGLLSTGPLDEVAHLATAALGLMVLVCFIDAPRRFYAAALVASVAIDLDHIPLYLGLLPDRSQRPVTHSLATVVVLASAAAAGRRHRAVLAGAATGLVLHFARDLAEGPPGVRILWPVQQSAWTASYWWFLGMIIVFTAARLILVSTSVPRTRVRLFQPPSASRSAAPTQLPCMSPGNRFPDREAAMTDSEGGGKDRLSRPNLPARDHGGHRAQQRASRGAGFHGDHRRHSHKAQSLPGRQCRWASRSWRQLHVLPIPDLDPPPANRRHVALRPAEMILLVPKLINRAGWFTAACRRVR